MDLGISGKRALVTGSTGGIGYAIAKGLAVEGAGWWSWAGPAGASMVRWRGCARRCRRGV